MASDEDPVVVDAVSECVPEGYTRYVVSAYSVERDGWHDVHVCDLPLRTQRKAAVAEAIRKGKLVVHEDPTRVKVRVLDELNAGEIPLRPKREDADPLAHLQIG